MSRTHAPQGQMLSHPRLQHDPHGTFLSHRSLSRLHSAQESSPMQRREGGSVHLYVLDLSTRRLPRMRFISISFISSSVIFRYVLRVGIVLVVSTGMSRTSGATGVKWKVRERFASEGEYGGEVSCIYERNGW